MLGQSLAVTPVQASVGRYYLAARPTCVVFNLGIKVDSGLNSLTLYANCSVDFGSNQVAVGVYGNDDLLLDTYLMSIMVYVMK